MAVSSPGQACSPLCSARCSGPGGDRRYVARWCRRQPRTGVLAAWQPGPGIYERGTRLPELSLRNAAGESVQLADFRGRPLVINLWASWCPPCRREMPVLQQAQAENPDVVFLFANQGESAETVRHFLQGENLRLDNLLFDNGGQLGQQVGSVALPTTVFYTAEGRLLGSHLGELSRGSLARYLEAFEPAAAAPATRSSE